MSKGLPRGDEPRERASRGSGGSAPRVSNGEMSEWLKEHAWKACVGETLPWVRIPLSPPVPTLQFSSAIYSIRRPKQWSSAISSAIRHNFTRLRLAENRNLLASRDARLNLSTRKEHVSLYHRHAIVRFRLGFQSSPTQKRTECHSSTPFCLAVERSRSWQDTAIDGRTAVRVIDRKQQKTAERCGRFPPSPPTH